MTAIQRMTRARIFMIIVPIIPLPISRALDAPFFAWGSRSQIVFNVIPLSFVQNLKVVVLSFVVISTLSH
jgi:hypothetical protein